MRGAATQATRDIVEERFIAVAPQGRLRRCRFAARNPSGWCRSRPICGVARRQRCHHIASFSLLASRPQAAPAKGKGFRTTTLGPCLLCLSSWRERGWRHGGGMNDADPRLVVDFVSLDRRGERVDHTGLKVLAAQLRLFVRI